jgi:oligopeptide transport system substrate-binding protein
MNLKILAAPLLACLILGDAGTAAADEHVLRLRLPGQSETLDSHLRHVVADRVLDTMMLDGLTREDATGAPVPAAATSWEISPDGRRYTFHLRPGAKFSDGHPGPRRIFSTPSGGW